MVLGGGVIEGKLLVMTKSRTFWWWPGCRSPSWPHPGSDVDIVWFRHILRQFYWEDEWAKNPEKPKGMDKGRWVSSSQPIYWSQVLDSHVPITVAAGGGWPLEGSDIKGTWISSTQLTCSALGARFELSFHHSCWGGDNLGKAITMLTGTVRAVVKLGTLRSVDLPPI